MVMRRLVVLLLVTLPWAAYAAPSAQAKREIQGLMDALSTSSCEFQRNGTWHGREEARKHLQRKYDYLLKKNLVDTAEQFIERAASKSSMSGRAYQVRCPGQPAQPAATWFAAKLDALRGSGAPVR
ncbi:DUF5329 domain-containing protein [Pseudoxanthomonas sp. LjRoot143]|uniref:DUF5329 domain-containing protein n=1 Tax=Pseudoxanthomonas sp. LjRoot143 TaxID=3342266 RepID=UPI003ECE9CA9